MSARDGSEVRLLRAALDAERRRSAEWQRIAEERRGRLERIVGHPLFRLAAPVLRAARRVAWALRRTARLGRRAAVDPAVLLARSVVSAPRRATAGRRLRRLAAEVAAAEARAASTGAAAVPDDAVPVDRTGVGARPTAADVTAIVVTRDQPARLARLLDGLDAVGVVTVVVENAASAATAAVLVARPRVVRVATPHVRYARANALGAEVATTPWLLLLNDDVEPVGTGWLDALLDAATPDTSVIGAQLVHGRRGWLGGTAVDATVQHDGIVLDATGPVPRPHHRGRRARPVVDRDAEDVLAVTGACLLVRAEDWHAVGGMDDGYDFGAEDVDLCVRVAARGRVRVAHRAVLLHHEGATRLEDDPERRRARQARNWERFLGRHAAALHRAAVLDRFDGRCRVADDPLRVTVVGGDPARSAALASALPAARLRTFGGRVGRRRGAGAGRVDLVVVLDPARRPAQEAALPVSAPCAAWFDGPDAVGPGLRAGWSERADVALVPDAATAAAVAYAAPTLPTRTVGAGPDPDLLRTALRDLVAAPRWSLRIGAPDARRAARWGDTPVARALAGELRPHGIVARVATRDRWGVADDAIADVAVQLKGRGTAPTAPGRLDVVWVMSHPSEVAPDELDAVDLVLAGSSLLAADLAGRTTTPVVVLPQGADGRRFAPGPVDPSVASRVLFVGNTRSEPRPSVLACLRAGLPLTLVGSGWERFVDPAAVRAAWVEPDRLAAWYRSADVVLNDHWDDMRRWGLVSNRVLEVLASGGCVVSDDVAGLAELVGDTVPVHRDDEGLVALVRALLEDPARRRDLAERGGALVRAEHLLEHRAARLVAAVASVAADAARRSAGTTRSRR